MSGYKIYTYNIAILRCLSYIIKLNVADLILLCFLVTIRVKKHDTLKKNQVLMQKLLNLKCQF